jgi:hypothetical protein
MPAASRDELPLREITPGYSSRFAGWGGMTQAYDVEPGHRISFEEDSEAVELTPTAELERTLAVVRANAAP